MKRFIKKGFTLIELVIVIAVIAILSAILIPSFSNIVKKANYSADLQIASTLNTSLALYDDDIYSENDLRKALDNSYGDGYYDGLSAQSSKYGYQYYYDIAAKKIIVSKYEDLGGTVTTEQLEENSQQPLLSYSFVNDAADKSSSKKKKKKNEKNFNGLYNVTKDGKNYLLLGVSSGDGDLNKLMKDLETVSSIEDYATILNKLENGDDLYKALAENLK